MSAGKFPALKKVKILRHLNYIYTCKFQSNKAAGGSSGDIDLLHERNFPVLALVAYCEDFVFFIGGPSAQYTVICSMTY